VGQKYCDSSLLDANVCIDSCEWAPKRLVPGEQRQSYAHGSDGEELEEAV